MKDFTRITLKKAGLVFSFLLLAGISYAAVFTATASGNFSSSATWTGGIIPPTTLTSDVIMIPLGITVNLDENLTINGALAQLNINGSLTTDQNASLLIETGSLTGTGILSIHSMDFNTGATISFTGSVYVKELNVNATLVSTADMTVDKTLSLGSGDLTFIAGGSLSLSPEARMVFSGGTITEGVGGTVNLSTDYTVVYNGSSTTSGLELTGSGLMDLEVNMDQGNILTLTSDATLSGRLALNGGTLALNDHDLVIQGDVSSSANGKISSTSLSDITIQVANSTTGSLIFEAGSELNNLVINLPADNSAKIEGHLSVYGNLDLSGGILQLDNADIKIFGDVTGSGMVSSSLSTDLTIDTQSGISSTLRFDAAGQTLNNLTVSTGGANELTIGSNLTVKGTLALLNESILKLEGISLMLDTESTLSGTGTIRVDENTSLVINAIAGIDDLKIDGTLGNLTVNTDASSSVQVASDVQVAGMLALHAGTIMLNDFDLTVMGDISAASGKVFTTPLSDVTISSATNAGLTFAEGSIMKSLTIDAGASNKARISGSVTIDSLMQLSSGILQMQDANITLNGDLKGSGMLGSTNADLVINATTGLSESLRFTPEAKVLNSLLVNIADSNVLRLGSDLTIGELLHLAVGNVLDISGKSLVLDAGSNLTGTGSLNVDAASSLTINSTTDISALVLKGTIGDLAINTQNASVTLASDAFISGTLTLASGEMILDNKDLIIKGDISSSGTGTIESTTASDIIIDTETSLSGMLRFSADGNAVGDLTIQIADKGSIGIASDLTVANNLNLQGGILDINTRTLSMSSLTAVTGASPTAYVKADATGSIDMDISVCDTLILFPIGTPVAFTPAYVNLKCGSEMGKVQFAVIPSVHTEGLTGTDLSLTRPLVNTTWDIASTVETGLAMDLKVMWPVTLEANAFNRSDAFISHYTNGTWDVSARASATAEANGMYSLERSNITSLSPFAVFDGNTIVATNDINDDLLLQAYPNPAVENLIIQSPAVKTEPVNMEIFSSTGQLIGQYLLTSEQSIISVSEFLSGNYFIRFYNKELSHTQQFTKM